MLTPTPTAMPPTTPELSPTPSPSPLPTPARIKAPNFPISLFERDATPQITDLLQFLGKYVVLHFWGGLCPPCRANIPALQQFHEQWADQIVVLAIDVGPQTGLGSSGDAKAILEQMEVTYPAGFTDDPQVLTRYQVIGMPTTIFISPSGQVYDRRVGLIDLNTLNRIAESMIQEPEPTLTPTPTPIPPVTPPPVPDCPGFELELEILLRLTSRLPRDPTTSALLASFDCRLNGASLSFAPAAGHSNSFVITRFATRKEARTGLGREGASNSTFRGSPAVHVSQTGSPVPDSLREKATSFDDTRFRVTLNVVWASEQMYDEAVELAMFSAEPDPTPTPTPNCGYSFAYLHHPELSEKIKSELDPTAQTVTSVFSRAYGENRFCDGEVLGFGAMETAIELTLEADTLPDIQGLATLMLAVVDALPNRYDSNIGPRFIITFVAGDTQARADFSTHTLADVRDRQLQGSELLEALGYRSLPSP